MAKRHSTRAMLWCGTLGLACCFESNGTNVRDDINQGATQVRSVDGRQWVDQLDEHHVANEFITLRDGRLFEGEREFRFLGFAAPNLAVGEDQILGDYSNRFPDEYELRDVFESMRQAGARATRLFTFSFRGDNQVPSHFEQGDSGDQVFRPNETAFRVFDVLLKLAGEYDVRLIVPFIDSHDFPGFHGMEVFARWSLGSSPSGAVFFSDPKVKGDFQELIRYVLNRTNTETGVRYQDDPAILAWQVANEPGSYYSANGKPPETLEQKLERERWECEMSAFIKAEDGNHLVLSSDTMCPTSDITGRHYYQEWKEGGDIVEALRQDVETYGGRTAIIADEFGMSQTEMLLEFMRELTDGPVAGGLLWGIRGHRRDGGFYYHNEYAGWNEGRGPGESKYNSYHWPGFEPASGYDEQRVLEELQALAWRMRGQEVPSFVPAPAPKLLCVSPDFELRWRGSAGASGYDIERSSSEGGPWVTVATGVVDEIEPRPGIRVADVFRPFWRDASAVAGRSYFYRVLGRSRGGATAPSNVKGVGSTACDAVPPPKALSDCDDIAPPEVPGFPHYTCQQQASWGKCEESWMLGYCRVSCGACVKAE